MHEGLTSYHCIFIILTAVLYSPIKVKIVNSTKRYLLSTPTHPPTLRTIMNIIIFNTLIILIIVII